MVRQSTVISTSAHEQEVPWPSTSIDRAVVLLDEADHRISTGFSTAFHQDVIVSVRDLGDDTSASFWDEEISRLSRLRHGSAARILETRIEADRFFVMTVLRPDGLLLSTRLDSGPLDPDEALSVALATLDVVVALHELGLSASGIRLRSAVKVKALDGQERYVVATFGLAVDNDIDMFNELREVALRVLALMGCRYENRALTVPNSIPEPLVAALVQAFGLSGPAFPTPGDLALAMLTALGKRARVSARSRTLTRPHRGASTVVTSDLLLASDYLATLPAEPPIDLVVVPRSR